MAFLGTDACSRPALATLVVVLLCNPFLGFAPQCHIALAADSDSVSLEALTALAASRLEVDPVTQVHHFVVGQHSIFFCPGMDRYLVNGALLSFGQPVRIDRGAVHIPRSLFRHVESYPRQERPRVPGAGAAQVVRKVVIDPGHGGQDPGAIGPTGLQEKAINLDVGRRLRTALQARGIPVTMTRTQDAALASDHRADLQARVDCANREQPDLFISIHSNYHFRPGTHGVETFYSDERYSEVHRARLAASAGRPSAPHLGALSYLRGRPVDRILHGLLLEEYRTESAELAESVQRALVEVLGVKDRGTKQGPFYVIRWPRCPAILVEVGFVSHAATEQNLRRADYLQTIAQALAKGIMEFDRELARLNPPD